MLSQAFRFITETFITEMSNTALTVNEGLISLPPSIYLSISVCMSSRSHYGVLDCKIMTDLKQLPIIIYSNYGDKVYFGNVLSFLSCNEVVSKFPFGKSTLSTLMACFQFHPIF